MNWERDRLLLALTDSPLKLGTKQDVRHESSAGQPIAESLYQAYCAFYQLDMRSLGLASCQSIHCIHSLSYDLAFQHFMPARAAKRRPQALIIHGYFDHAGLYRHLIAYLLKLGIEVLVFDLPGHGLSSGKRAAINDFSAYQICLKQVVKNELDLTRPINIIGQSTGAAVIADYFCDPMNIDEPFYSAANAVLFAPLLKPESWAKAEFMHSLIHKHKDYWPRSFKTNTHDPEFLDFVKNKDPLQHHALSVEWIGALREWLPNMLSRSPSEKSMVLIQGTDDDTVDWQFNLEAYRKLFPLNKSILIQYAGHHLVGESKEYRDKVFSELGRVLQT